METISKISTRKPKKEIEYDRCARTDNSFTCPARQVKCNKRTRIGHFARKCRTSLKRQFIQPNNGGAKRSRTEVRQVKDEGSFSEMEPTKEICFPVCSDEEGDELIICSIGGKFVNETKQSRSF